MDDQLDELLCEYVDGTMDPSVKVVFEEYLEANPDLAAHVKCLSETRNMLCRIGECACATASQAQLRVRLARELARQNQSAALMWSRLGSAALLTSTVGLLLIFGMIAGVSVVQRTQVSGTQESAPESALRMDSMEIPTDAHGFIGRSMRLESIPGRTGSGMLGPISALPVVAGRGYMTPLETPAQIPNSQRPAVEASLQRISR